MVFIASTLSNDQEYIIWDKPEMAPNAKVARPSRIKHTVFVKGKANVITKHLITPEGVLTQVTDEQLDMLNAVPQFKDHVDRGHLKILNREAPAEKVVRDMTDRDDSAPLSVAKGDFKKGGRAGGKDRDLAPKEVG